MLQKRTSGLVQITNTIVDTTQKYIMYISDEINLLDFNNIISQENFKTLVQAISLRALPIIREFPIKVTSLEKGTKGIPGFFGFAGGGNIFLFETETIDVYQNTSKNGTIGTCGLLIDDLDNLQLPDGVVVRTKIAPNIVVVRKE